MPVNVGKTFNLYSTSTENNQKLDRLHCLHQRCFRVGLTGCLVIGWITSGVPCIGGLDGFGEPMATLLSRTAALMFHHLLVSMHTGELFAARNYIKHFTWILMKRKALNLYMICVGSVNHSLLVKIGRASCRERV